MARRGRKPGGDRQASRVKQLPWQEIINSYPAMEILSNDQLEQIHEASLRILENIGMRVMHQGARIMLAGAGAEAGTGGHFFGVEHTLSRYQTAFYQPLLSDQRNFENWQDAGSVDAQTRANRLWKQLLKDYQQPPLDPAIDEELTAYVARRKEVLLIQK